MAQKVAEGAQSPEPESDDMLFSGAMWSTVTAEQPPDEQQLPPPQIVLSERWKKVKNKKQLYQEACTDDSDAD